MRAREFTVYQKLDEVAMNPKSLKAEAMKINALVGMEFEMYVPNVQISNDDDDDNQVQDWDQDERVRTFDGIIDFFDDRDYNSLADIERLRRYMEHDFSIWQQEKLLEYWERNTEAIIEWYFEFVEDMPPLWAKNETQKVMQGISSDPKNAEIYNWFMQNSDKIINGEYDKDEWARQWNTMAGVMDSYDSVRWPYWIRIENEGVDETAIDFMNSMGYDSIVKSDTYHGTYTRWDGQVWSNIGKNKPTDCYTIEPDGSLTEPGSGDDGGLEFVSPPITIANMVIELDKVRNWANRNGCYTNESTGLHINISIANTRATEVDYVKLALLLGDEYVLEQFQRSASEYCVSAIERIKRTINAFSENALLDFMNKMKSGLDQMASHLIKDPSLVIKQTSIHPQLNRIEFRSPGGDWLDENFDKVENTLYRMVVALDAAHDPQKYRKEYLTKLYKLLSPKSENDTLAYFAKYAAGELPKVALKSFIRQAQLERTKSALRQYNLDRQAYLDRQKVKDTYNELKPAAVTNTPASGLGSGRVVDFPTQLPNRNPPDN